MQCKKFSITVALTTTLTTNIYNPAAATGGVNGGTSGQYAVFRLLRVVNKTGVAATFSLWRGATGANAAGTELAIAKNVPANDWVDVVIPDGLRFDVADFLVGGAGTTTALVLLATGEVGVSG